MKDKEKMRNICENCKEVFYTYEEHGIRCAICYAKCLVNDYDIHNLNFKIIKKWLDYYFVDKEKAEEAKRIFLVGVL